MISLLQAVLGQEALLPSRQEEYQRILKEIRMYYMSSQVYHLLKEKGLLEQTPEFFRHALKQDYQQFTIQNLLIKRIDGDILLAFESEGIPVIPLKGPRFAETYYGHIGARPSSDIDLLVHPHDLKRAAACVQGLHFQPNKEIHNHAVLERRLGPGNSPLLAVELHWSLDKKNWSNLNDSRFWERARLLDGCRFARELSVSHTFYFICLHGVRHEMDSVKYLLDIVFMLLKYGRHISLEQVLEEAAADRTSKRVKAALSIVYEQFPWLEKLVPLPFKPLNTYWTYSAILKKYHGIKDLEYYRYVSFFKFRMFDTLKHTVLSQQHIYNRTVKYSSFSKEQGG